MRRVGVTGAPFASIMRGNAEEWTAWSLFGRELADLSGAAQLELADLVDRAERHLGTFPEGYNAALHGQCMRLTLEPIAGKHRPLLVRYLLDACSLMWPHATVQPLSERRSLVRAAFAL